MGNDKYLENKESIITFMKKVVEMHPDYVMQENIIHRFNKKYKLKDYILFILEEFPDGLHFSEINRQIKEKFNIDVDDRKVHVNLTQLSWLFMNIGLWIYTLKSNTKYSSEKTWDLIYLYLKQLWEPKSTKDISEYVLSRKKIEENTVYAALDYPHESRFVFLNDWRVWLKEWWLSNLREKKLVNRYEISLNEGFDLLLENNELPKTFTTNEFIDLISLKFGDEISKNRSWFSPLLSKKVLDWIISCDNSKLQNTYFLI